MLSLTVIIDKALDGLIIRLVYNSMRTKDLMKYALPVYAKRTVNQIIQEQNENSNEVIMVILKLHRGLDFRRKGLTCIVSPYYE